MIKVFLERIVIKAFGREVDSSVKKIVAQFDNTKDLVKSLRSEMKVFKLSVDSILEDDDVLNLYLVGPYKKSYIKISGLSREETLIFKKEMGQL